MIYLSLAAEGVLWWYHTCDDLKQTAGLLGCRAVRGRAGRRRTPVRTFELWGRGERRVPCPDPRSSFAMPYFAADV